MKISLIGQDIPSLLPSLLADLLFSARQPADIAIEERNEAMADLLRRYTETCLDKAGLGGGVLVTRDRREALSGADCVIYAGDVMPASRFRQDREALSGVEEGDAGLTDQARVNAGIGGLMHSLRQGSAVLDVTDVLREAAPGALVITLGQPLSTTVRLFEEADFRCYGLGPSPLQGPNGLPALMKLAGLEGREAEAGMAGLPGFSWLLSLSDRQTGEDLLPAVGQAAESGKLGQLTKRWLKLYGAVPVGTVTSHAERMPQQEDYSPDPDPAFGETVERRKERILWMNRAAENRLGDAEGQMAQMLLLSRAPATRPVQLALALLNRSSLRMEGVSRLNRGALAGLPDSAVIEARLDTESPQALTLPGDLRDLCLEADDASRLAAHAAYGSRSDIREWVETAPELEGLDRLYLQEAVERMLDMHDDILPRFFGDDND
ncbi:MAG: hypothetical protein IKP40_12285 [Clostridia bacterium]|nr:hypothetical protein [Clostridia bacterium]